MEGMLSDDVVMMVAHDLTHPLMCILGYSDLLAKNHAGEEMKLQFIQKIHSCSLQAIALIEEFQQATALELGKFSLCRKPEVLEEIVRAAVDACGILCQQKGIELALIAPPGPVMLSIDAERIHRVIQNLLSNAIKHVPQGGKIEVSVSDLAGAALVEVSDNGPGIDSAYQSRVFEKFVQVERNNGWRDKLYAGKLTESLGALRRLKPRTKEGRETVRRVIAYYVGNRKRMRYKAFRRKGCFIGSGVTESSCKRLVGARLKQAGMRWTIPGAQAILQLRTAVLNDRWDYLWAC